MTNNNQNPRIAVKPTLKKKLDTIQFKGNYKTMNEVIEALLEENADYKKRLGY